jgi:hypothetical protein
MIDAHSRWDVELDGHSIGPFREHLKETLINKLVDLRWHGVALADSAHWSISGPGEARSVEVYSGRCISAV